MGENVSRSTVSRITKRLDKEVEALRRTPIEGEHPYLYLDATFVDARWARRVENVSALLQQLVERGLSGVRLVITDEHLGLER